LQETANWDEWLKPITRIDLFAKADQEASSQYGSGTFPDVTAFLPHEDEL